MQEGLRGYSEKTLSKGGKINNALLSPLYVLFEYTYETYCRNLNAFSFFSS